MQNQEENIDMYVCQSTQGGVIMKKSVVYLLAGVLMFQLAACGNDANNSQESSGSQSSSESILPICPQGMWEAVRRFRGPMGEVKVRCLERKAAGVKK